MIDSGIDFTHPELANNQWNNLNPINGDPHGWDFVTDSGVIRDEQGHGTAVAGIIAAQGNNATGMTGVMWRASLMSLRVLDNTGTGDIANAVEAIDYAAMHRAQDINLSWGTSGMSLSLKDAIERAIRRGVVVVCSAGNSSQDVESVPYYPASFGSRDLIAVAASDNFDQLTSWSNWGRTKVSIAAPGANILTTQMGGGYSSVSGTSAAAPLVSGVAGLLKGAKPWLNPHGVLKAITDGARKVVSLSGKVASGGVLDAAQAFDSARPYGNGGGNGGGGANPRGGSAHGPGGGFNTPPPVTTGGPLPNLPNLDQLRNEPTFQPKAKAPIQSNMICADCDPLSGGGGGGYYPASDPNFSTARMRLLNETGQQGEDLGSRNFNWSVPLVSLPGRSGLDVNLTLYYNSLVWTKDGPFIKYNADLGSPAPGFKLGFPTLQQKFTDSDTGGSIAFIMVLPSGARVAMQQVGTTTVYESQDSTYTQLTDNGASGALVRTTDGTQFTFTHVTINNEYRCTQIKDRNGNYISANYDATNGHILSITDTLNRVVNFIYDGNNNLQFIRQTWASGTHDWATFYYGEVFVQPGFGGGLLVNGPNGNTVTVLTQVNLDDGSYLTFNYNSLFGQVSGVNHYAPDNHLLAYTKYNVSSATGQTECPRFTERRDWARYWNGDNDDVPATSEEAVTSYAVDPSGAGAWSKVTMPDLSIYKEFYATSGWQTGLTTTTKNYVDAAAEQADTAKKWTTINWTQDDTNLTYQKNPRVSETNIYDAEGNRKRTTIDYTSYSLPNAVREWTGTGANVLYRMTATGYRFDAEYINRRIIGLVDNVQVTDGAGALVSKVTYGYDWDWSGDMFQDTPAAATQHDRTNYGPTFIFGRGNLSEKARWDVNDPQNLNNTIVETKWRVNSTGAVLMIRDHLWHQTFLDYGDSFSDAVNRNTFAYPTTVTDPEGFSSTAQYNYDFGAATRTQSPPPGGTISRDHSNLRLRHGGSPPTSHHHKQSGAQSFCISHNDGRGSAIHDYERRH